MLNELLANFPNLRIFSRNDIKKTEKKLAVAGLKIKPGVYLSASLILSCVLSVLIGLLSFAFVDLETSIIIIFPAFILFYILWAKVPSFLGKRRAREMETDLPLILRSFATQINTGISFEHSIRDIANSDYAISMEFREAINEINGGASVPSSLRSMASRIDSLMVKRVVQRLIELYRNGSKAESIKHLADELIEKQKASAREYNARMSFLGLLFVVCSCIIPALFQAYSIAGSTFLSESFSTNDIWLMYIVVFPSINALLLLIMHDRTPKLIRKRKESIFSSKNISQFDKVLLSLGYPKFSIIIFVSVCASILLMALSILLSFVLSYNYLYSFLFFFFPMFVYLVIMRMSEERTEAMESFMPDALLQASSMPRGTPIEKTISSLADSDYGPLSDEFSLVSKQLSSGSDVVSSLKSVSDFNESTLFSRTSNLIIQAYLFGGDMHVAMKETAEDIFSIFSIIKEREAIMALQKYTLLFSGGVILPLILASISRTISQMDFSGLDVISSVSFETRQELIYASTEATTAYLLIYSLLASVFISKNEGSWRRFSLYFFPLAALSISIYKISLTFDILSSIS